MEDREEFGKESTEEKVGRSDVQTKRSVAPETVQPEKIILFGSAARGEMGPNSDVDLLVIKGGADSLEMMTRIYVAP